MKLQFSDNIIRKYYNYSLFRLLPSLTVGEYGPAVERPEEGGLYPLEEEGKYGAKPKQKYPG